MAAFPMVLRRFSFVVTRQETNSQRLLFICQTLWAIPHTENFLFISNANVNKNDIISG